MHFSINTVLVQRVNFIKISLKYLKVLRHVSILRDHLQGVYLYLAKFTGLFKNLRIFNFKTLNLKSRPSTPALWQQNMQQVCVVTLVVQCVALHHKGVTTHTCYICCCHNARVDRRDFKFSVLKLKILKFLNNPVNLARYKYTP